MAGHVWQPTTVHERHLYGNSHDFVYGSTLTVLKSVTLADAKKREICPMKRTIKIDVKCGESATSNCNWRFSGRTAEVMASGVCHRINF